MKKFVRITICVILFLLLILEAIGCYAAIGFFEGKKAAESKIVVDKNVSFSGDEPVSEKEITIMFVGDDGREGDDDDGRSDTLMIAHYNNKTHQPKLISIMRDTYINIPNYGMDKINASYTYGGAQLAKETLNENFGIPINYYAVVDFNNFIQLIDELYPKGVSIDAEKDISLDGVDIVKGPQVMDGNTLLQYARFRMDEEGDFGRVRRQQQVMDALSQQAKNAVSVMQLPRIAGEAVGYLDTNIPTELLIDLAKDFLTGKVEELETLSVPVDDSWQFNDYTTSGSVIEIDLQKNAQAVQDFLNGKGIAVVQE